MHENQLIFAIKFLYEIGKITLSYKIYERVTNYSLRSSVFIKEKASASKFHSTIS